MGVRGPGRAPAELTELMEGAPEDDTAGDGITTGGGAIPSGPHLRYRLQLLHKSWSWELGSSRELCSSTAPLILHSYPLVRD